MNNIEIANYKNYYDDKGRLSLIVCIDTNETIYECKYYDDGNVRLIDNLDEIIFKDYDDNDVRVFDKSSNTVSYNKYDNKGNLISKKIINPVENVELSNYKYEYTYNKKGTISSKKEYKDDILMYENKKRYNEDILLISDIYKNYSYENGESVLFSTKKKYYEYNELGRLTKEKEIIEYVNNVDKNVTTVIAYVYDEFGNNIVKTINDDLFEYKYDDNGNMIHYHDYKKDIVKEYQYDNNGNIILELDWEEYSMTSYYYDDKGNIIKLIQSKIQKEQ